LSLTSLLSAPKREVTSPSDFKVVGALNIHAHKVISDALFNFQIP
jgi:hypothetical protein